MNDKHNAPLSSLKGHLLLAMPQMNDPRFHRSVIFVCVHDKKGAMGLTINNPLPSPDFMDVLMQLGILSEKPLDNAVKSMRVLSGGPVESGHGFLLHSSDFVRKDTIHIDDMFSVSGTIDSLKAIVDGMRPEKMLFTLGYAGWGPGQLDRELQDNVWIAAPASFELVFGSRPEDMWDNAFTSIGVNPGMISGIAGHA